MSSTTITSASGRTIFSVDMNETSGVGTVAVMQDGMTVNVFSTSREMPTAADRDAEMAAREALVAANSAPAVEETVETDTPAEEAPAADPTPEPAVVDEPAARDAEPADVAPVVPEPAAPDAAAPASTPLADAPQPEAAPTEDASGAAPAIEVPATPETPAV